MLPWNILLKSCDLGGPQYVITNVKIIIFRVINQHQPNLIAKFPSRINEDVHVCTKNNIYKFVGEVWGVSPRSRRNF